MQRPSLWHIFLLTAALQLLGSVLYFLVFENAVAIQATYFITKAIILVAPVALLLAGFHIPRFSFRQHVATSLLLGFGTGLAIAGVMLGFFALFNDAFAQFGPTVLSKVTEIGILSWYWPAVLLIAVIHSLFEEYYVRWYLVKGFETHFTPWQAILIGNGLFAVHHFIILSQFVTWPFVLFFGTFVGVGGVIWSLLYQRTNSLLAPWISHACADVAIFIVGYILMQG